MGGYAGVVVVCIVENFQVADLWLCVFENFHVSELWFDNMHLQKTVLKTTLNFPHIG